MARPSPQRINVIGTSGSGKTTVARALAELLGASHIEIDAIHWQEDWTEMPDDQIRIHLARATADDAWVIDGNYSNFRDLVWPRCDTVIWLDYSFARVFSQLLARTVARIVDREVLWNGNRERWRTAVFSRDSILLWAIQTHWRRKRSTPVELARPEWAHLNVVRLRSRRETHRWLCQLKADLASETS